MSMKSISPEETRKAVAKALKRLNTPKGRKELRAAMERVRKESEARRQTLNVSPAALNRRFTI
jgi:hypothetical protein